MFVSTSVKETTASINSIVVWDDGAYSDETSRVTSRALFGRVARLASLLRKSVVSLMCESKEATRRLM